jgi:Cft2 family RNA processing exonuclease
LSTLTFTPIGAGSSIGANCYLVTANGHQLLLDCGVHPKIEGYESLPKFELLNRTPDAVVLSHGHIDHCGSLPYFMREFPETMCYVTEPTVGIIDRMLHNSVSVMGKLAVERGISEYPLYSHEDVDYAIAQTRGIPVGLDFQPTRSHKFVCRFQHAGHVLGSAGILIQTTGHNFYYTGDICRTNQELMEGMTMLDPSIKIDTLVIESTRGAHVDEYPKTYDGEIARFAAACKEVLERGGCVLVPAFALGRTQELCNILSRLQREGLVPHAPIYASGLGRAIYEIYNRYQDYLRDDAALMPLTNFKRIGDIWDRRTRKALLSEPGIIVATSGMMLENTPSAMIAMDMVQQEQHGIFFAGYLDPDTLGYKLQHAQPGAWMAFELNAPAVEVKLANIQSFHFSAHAPREDLLSVIEHFHPKNLIFVHGDPEAVDWMRSNTNGYCKKFAPEIGESVVLES